MQLQLVGLAPRLVVVWKLKEFRYYFAFFHFPQPHCMCIFCGALRRKLCRRSAANAAYACGMGPCHKCLVDSWQFLLHKQQQPPYIHPPSKDVAWCGCECGCGCNVQVICKVEAADAVCWCNLQLGGAACCAMSFAGSSLWGGFCAALIYDYDALARENMKGEGVPFRP